MTASPTRPAPDKEVLAGLIERVTFRNADNGFCVLRVKARGHRELITVVGHAATIAAGRLPWPAIDPALALPWIEAKTGLALAPSQAEAIRPPRGRLSLTLA